MEAFMLVANSVIVMLSVLSAGWIYRHAALYILPRRLFSLLLVVLSALSIGITDTTVPIQHIYIDGLFLTLVIIMNTLHSRISG